MLNVLAGLAESIPITLLAVLPAFFNLASERIFEEEKALLLRAAALVALPATAWAWRAYGSRTWRHPVVLTYAALTLVLSVAALSGVDPRTSILGAYLKHHGMVTWFALATLFAAMCGVACSGDGRRRLLDAVVIGSIWPSIYALLQHAGADPVEWTGANAERSISSLGSPNYLGGYLAIVIPLTLLRGRSTRWLWALVPLQLAALAATASRGSIVGLAAGALAGGIAYLWTQPGGRVRAAAVLTVAVAATVVLVAMPGARPAPLARMFDATGGSGRVRVLIWKGVVDLMRRSGARRWTGYGPETLHEIFPPHYPAELGVVERSDAMPDRAHNETLDMLVSAGVPGVVVELAFFAAVIVCAFRARDPLTCAALVAAAVAHIVEIQLGIATVVSRLVFLGVAALVVGVNQVEPAAAAAPALPRAVARRQRRAPQRAAGRTADRPSVWLLVAAMAGALSPWMGAMTLPLAYGAVLAAAIALSRSNAFLPRPAGGGVLLLCGTLTAAIAAIPLAVTPARADAFSKSATQFESRGQWPEAAAAYREAVALQPHEAYYVAGLGRALLQDAVRLEPAARSARLRESREAFERARALMPSDPDHMRHLASLARVEASVRADGRDAPLAEADRLYAKETVRVPGLAALWVDWGWVDVDRRRLPQALDKVNHALALNHDRVDAWLLRGYIHASQSQWNDALADYAEVLSRKPDNPEALRGRASAQAAIQR